MLWQPCMHAIDESRARRCPTREVILKGLLGTQKLKQDDHVTTRESVQPTSLTDKVFLVVAVLRTPFWGFQGTPNNCTESCCFAISRPTTTGPVGESAGTGCVDPPPRAFAHSVSVPNPHIMSWVQSEDELVLCNWAQCDKVTVQPMTSPVGVGESHWYIWEVVAGSVKLFPSRAAVLTCGETRTVSQIFFQKKRKKKKKDVSLVNPGT